MNRHFIIARTSILLGLLASFVLPLPALAATVALANAPLATSTTTSVKPNLLFILDNSGSMDWDHMPDDKSDPGSDVSWEYGYYGMRSSQCNQVYYDPNTKYDPPVNAAGTPYANASFTAAYSGGQGGYASSPTTINLNTNFQANQTNIGNNAGGTDSNRSAYYYEYFGAQNTQLEKNYNSLTPNTFFTECNYAENNATALTLFSKRRLATTRTTTVVVSGTGGGAPSASVPGITVNGVQIMNGASATVANISSSTMAANIAAKITLGGYSASAAGSVVTITGPTSATNYTPVIAGMTGNVGSITLTTDVFPDTTAANLTNFANWYSYYRTRMLMMKTATGQAFSNLNKNYRVGLMKISATNPVVPLGTFWDNTDTSLGSTSTLRTDWYAALYTMNTSGSTPLRRSLSDAGLYYAGQLSGTDPVQYSCQQNFSILSTDGYWNTGDGYLVDGSSAVGNQDGTESRPMYDGFQSDTTETTTYTRNVYSSSGTRISGGSNCTGSKKRGIDTLQTQSCAITTTGGVAGPEVCTSWSNTSRSYISPYTSNSSSCVNTVTLPSPATTAKVATGTVTTAGGTGGSSDTLSDVAEYYYKTDLRTTALGNCGTVVAPATEGPLCENNVFKSATDSNLQQHMTTFTLGLGASGWMNYSSSYLQDGTGDFAAVKLGSTSSSSVCTWQSAGEVCNWPLPGLNGSDGYIANIDDLWHAAVNGRGAYFSATNPATLSSGLASALAGINAKRGAAAAAATSTLNPVAGNNFAYVASYTTVDWKGNLEARGINTDTGVVSENATWCVENIIAGSCATAPVAQTSGDTTIYNCETPSAVTCPGGEIGFSGDLTTGPTYCKVQMAVACTGTMGPKVGATSDTRTIKTANSTGNALTNFDSAFATANAGYFNATTLAGLSQWGALDAAQRADAVGSNLVNYLRGQYGYEDRSTNIGPPDNRLYRFRSAVMGDALESQPSFISKPVFSYPYPGYGDYKTAQAARAGTVYMGANDGMMHAFASATGVERWAYVPSMVIPNMWKLADTNYATLHVNYVNGSPITTDVCVSNTTTTLANCNNINYASTGSTSDDPVWKTILVGGLNGGGRGYYALDITNPTTPVLLWEFTTMAGVGATTGFDDNDVGYSFGQPVITKRADGRWVVLITSGYNNVSPGDGKGYLYVLDAYDGKILSKISTGVGTTTTPSGLAKIAGWNEEPPGNSVRYVYGGDLLGNVWKFDISSTAAATIGTGDKVNFATLFSTAAGTAGTEQPIMTTPVLGKVAGSRVVFIGTGKYLETGDLTVTQKQTQYAIKDDNSGATFVNPRSQTTLMVQQAMTTNTATGTRSVAPANPAPNFYTGRGWFVDLPDTGERINIDSQLVQGVLLVPSIVPSNTACSPGGYGWLNFLDYKTGAALTPSGIVSTKYDSTIVGVNVYYIDGEPVVGVVTSTDPTPKKDDDVTFPPSAGNFTGKRSLWRELFQ